jgi:F0F1-type ATP synthase membrane subunit b/b'
MVKRKSPNTRKQPAKTENAAQQNETDRSEKIMNAMANASVILMSTMMGAFTQVMTTATGAIASGMAEAMGGKEAEKKVNEEIKQKLPEVDEKMKAMISDIRKDVYAQMRQKRKEMEPMLSNPKFDVGPKIIEKYNFKLPKLTQELDDEALAQYSKLLVSEDPSFSEMFGKLTEWMNSLPKPSEKTKKK